MSKPEWKQIASNAWWCKGCGCVKKYNALRDTWRYLTPRRERERRLTGILQNPSGGIAE